MLNYGKMVLDPLPNNSMLLVKGDAMTNVVRYLQVLWGLADSSLWVFELVSEQMSFFVAGV